MYFQSLAIGRRAGVLCMTAVLAFSALAGCSRSGTENVTISGSTTVIPVVSRAAENYMRENADIRIVVNAGGSGVGIKQVGEGQTDIGMASRDVLPEEFETYADAGLTVHSIGRDAVVPVISSEIYDAGVTALAPAQIAGIFAGEITNWSELGGPDEEIYVIDAEISGGTRQTFMKFIAGDKEADAPGADIVLASNNEKQTAVTQSDAAISMLSQAWMTDDVKGLSITVEDGTTVAPSLDNIVNGSYPITRDLILITRTDISAPASAFLTYIKGPEGQQVVEDSGYIGLAE